MVDIYRLVEKQLLSDGSKDVIPLWEQIYRCYEEYNSREDVEAKLLNWFKKGQSDPSKKVSDIGLDVKAPKKRTRGKK